MTFHQRNVDAQGESKEEVGMSSTQWQFEQVYQHVQQRAKSTAPVSKEQCQVHWQHIQARHPNAMLHLEEDIGLWIESYERVRLFWIQAVGADRIGLAWKIIQPFYESLGYTDWESNVPNLLRQIENVTGCCVLNELAAAVGKATSDNQSFAELQEEVLVYFPDAFGFDESSSDAHIL